MKPVEEQANDTATKLKANYITMTLLNHLKTF